jgi:hypothetical protein
MTLKKQEWRRKEAPQCSTAEPDVDGQTMTPCGQTANGTIPSGEATSSGGQTTQEVRGPTEDESEDPSSPHTLADGQTMSPGGPTTSSCRVDANSSANKISSPTGMGEDANDDLLDYKPSPTCDGMEINVIYLSSTDYSLLEEEEVWQLALGPQDAIFKVESGDHLKLLYVHGHLDGTPVARMLVDGGAAMNMMPYSTFKKLGKINVELIKMNMIITSIGGEGPIGPKGIASMELTEGSKTIPTVFFLTEVQGNYNTILGRDWIHANHCVPSTLRQFLIQWVRK